MCFQFLLADVSLWMVPWFWPNMYHVMSIIGNKLIMYPTSQMILFGLVVFSKWNRCPSGTNLISVYCTRQPYVSAVHSFSVIPREWVFLFISILMPPYGTTRHFQALLLLPSDEVLCVSLLALSHVMMACVRKISEMEFYCWIVNILWRGILKVPYFLYIICTSLCFH